MMTAITPESALTGFLFGVSSGVSPGPLAMLTISETIRAGQRAGIRIACSPLVSDLFIVSLSLLVFAGFSTHTELLALISLVGAAFLFYLGVKSLNDTPNSQPEAAQASEQRTGLYHAVILNILSPYPYIFWLSVGAPFLANLPKPLVVSWTAFFLAFYLGLCGSKIGIVLATTQGKKFLGSSSHRIILRVTAFVMFAFSVKLGFVAYEYWQGPV